MKQLKLGRNALILSITTLVTVLISIGFEIYRTAHQTSITKITKEQMVSLNPQIKTDLIEALKKNLFFTEKELNLPLSLKESSSSADHEED